MNAATIITNFLICLVLSVFIVNFVFDGRGIQVIENTNPSHDETVKDVDPHCNKYEIITEIMKEHFPKNSDKFVWDASKNNIFVLHKNHEGRYKLERFFPLNTQEDVQEEQPFLDTQNVNN